MFPILLGWNYSQNVPDIARRKLRAKWVCDIWSQQNLRWTFFAIKSWIFCPFLNRFNHSQCDVNMFSLQKLNRNDALATLNAFMLEVQEATSVAKQKEGEKKKGKFHKPNLSLCYHFNFKYKTVFFKHSKWYLSRS